MKNWALRLETAQRICSNSGNATVRLHLANPEPSPARGRCRDWMGSTYGFRSKVKGQSRPRTPKGGGESRSGMNPGAVGSNPAADTIFFPLLRLFRVFSGARRGQTPARRRSSSTKEDRKKIERRSDLPPCQVAKRHDPGPHAGKWIAQNGPARSFSAAVTRPPHTPPQPSPAAIPYGQSWPFPAEG